MSEKLCTQCHKPHDEDTKWCAACKAHKKRYKAQRIRLAAASGKNRCIKCNNIFDEPHDFKTCNACREKSRGYRKEHRDVLRVQEKEYKDAHRDKIRLHDIFYRNEHHEKLIAQSREYNARHSDVRNANSREYKRDNPMQFRVYEHNRRARKRENGGTFSFKELNEQFERQEGFCYYCGRLLYSSFDNDIHIDHMTPISRGGSNEISNIALSCATCNLKKHAKTAEEFLQEMNK